MSEDARTGGASGGESDGSSGGAGGGTSGGATDGPSDDGRGRSGLDAGERAVLERYEPIVDDHEAFLAACARPLPAVVRSNPIKAGPARVARAFREAGVASERRAWNDSLFALETDRPGNTWPYVHGWVHGQEEVSTVPARVLDPDPGSVVLDACAAPGGKATQLAGLMDDRGLLVANDANLGRLSALRSNADRLGVTCAAVTNRDGRSLALDGLGVDAVDAALVDAPCSCEGTVRKNPDTLADWSESYLGEIQSVQVGLLEHALDLTRPGGTVVYATCTFAPEENEAVLDAALASRDCRVVPFDLELSHAPGVTSWRDATYDPAVAAAKRIYPHHADTGGFFCAKLEVPA